MVWRLVFSTASLAFCTDLSYRPTPIRNRRRMIVVTIINSMSVNPAAASLLRRFTDAGLPIRICDNILNSNPHLNYQSEYLVPSRAVPVDFEYTPNTFLPPQLVQSGPS